MGNNEPLPPPPPPGFNPPPPPPAPQQFQQYAPAPQYSPAPAPVPPKKKTGLIVGVAVVVVAAVVGGIVLLTGDDDKNSSLGDAPRTSETTDDTLAVTVPKTTDETDTTDVTDTSDTGGMAEIVDDTKSFSVLLPEEFEVDSAPQANDGNPISHVSASPDLKGYYADHDTYGMTVMLAGPQIGVNVTEMLDYLSPKDGVCTTETDAPNSTTAFGDATVRLFDGCGATNGSAKVIMAVATDKGILAVYFQGPSGNLESLQSLASIIMLTVQLL